FNLATTPFDPELLRSLAAATAIAIAAYLVVGAIALKAAGLRIATFLPSLAFPNSGNLGLPLALYAASQRGLNDAIIIFSVTSIANMTAGQMIAAGKGQWKRAAVRPDLRGQSALPSCCNARCLWQFTIICSRRFTRTSRTMSPRSSSFPL